MNTPRIVALTLLVASFVTMRARADVAPNPGPCDHEDAGTACVVDDGTAGICTPRTNPRRPGITYMTCERDTHECDHLAVGAECHGYLHRPAHCREFTDDHHAHWRACTIDPAAYQNSAPAPGATPAVVAPAPSAPAPDLTRAPGVPSAPAAPHASHGCTASPHVGATSGLAAVAAALAMAFARRRRRARVG